MKYYNKKRGRKNWHKITIKIPNIRPDQIYPTEQFMYELQPVKHWCQRHSSTGRFYFNYSDWYFEKRIDALHFSLVWS